MPDYYYRLGCVLEDEPFELSWDSLDFREGITFFISGFNRAVKMFMIPVCSYMYILY